MVTSRTSSQLPTYLLKKGNMISKIYGSNQILFKVGSRKGKTKAQLQVMVERRKDKKYRNKNYKKWVQNLAMRRKKGWL